MNGRGISVLRDVDNGPLPKMSRRDAETIVVGSRFGHEDVNAIEEYSKWTKDALVVETMSLSHKILELEKIQNALIEQNKIQRENLHESELREKKSLWKANVLYTRLKFMLMGKEKAGVVSSTSNGEAEEGRVASRVHRSCPSCVCIPSAPIVKQECDGNQVISRFPGETMGVQLEYAVGVLVEDFQAKFKVAISNKRKEYVKTAPVGVGKVAWLRAARLALKTIGEAEEVVLHTGATAFLTRDDKLNWNPHQRFDNLLRCAKFILGGARHLDMLRVYCISDFLSLERLYFPMHEDAAMDGDQMNVVAVIWKSSVWVDLVKSLLRQAMPSGNEEYLMKVMKNLRRMYVPQQSLTP